MAAGQRAAERQRSRSVMGGSVVLAISSVFACPAVADRHCFPSLELYFMGRQILLGEDIVAETMLAAAMGRLDSALAEARSCGCSVLERELSALGSAASVQGLSFRAIGRARHGRFA